jgi:hypothetical protein
VAGVAGWEGPRNKFVSVSVYVLQRMASARALDGRRHDGVTRHVPTSRSEVGHDATVTRVDTGSNFYIWQSRFLVLVQSNGQAVSGVAPCQHFSIAAPIRAARPPWTSRAFPAPSTLIRPLSKALYLRTSRRVPAWHSPMTAASTCTPGGTSGTTPRRPSPGESPCKLGNQVRVGNVGITIRAKQAASQPQADSPPRCRRLHVHTLCDADTCSCAPSPAPAPQGTRKSSHNQSLRQGGLFPALPWLDPHLQPAPVAYGERSSAPTPPPTGNRAAQRHQSNPVGQCCSITLAQHLSSIFCAARLTFTVGPACRHHGWLHGCTPGHELRCSGW